MVNCCAQEKFFPFVALCREYCLQASAGTPYGVAEVVGCILSYLAGKFVKCCLRVRNGTMYITAT